VALALPAPVEEAIERIGGRRRAAIAAVGLVTVLLILGVSRLASRPTYVPVFNDLPLESVSKITAKLDEAAIPYRLENGGSTLQVPSTEVARARVALASAGLPDTGRPGMELFDQPSWGMTDFTQRINYRRALEGELERTIGKMTGIESAQVHLAMDETRSFQTDDRPKQASVVLRLRNGASAGPDVVTGIQHLVSSSVDGLVSDGVTVLDDSGRMLSAPNEPGSLAALTSRQLGMQREVESYLETKAQQIVDEVVGPSSAQIKVAAQINFDRVERTVQTVDPDGQVVQTEQKAEIIPGPQGGAGSNNTNIAYENSRSMESFTGATGNVKRLSVAVVVDEKRIPKGDSAIYQPRSAAELAQIETLVRNAVGADPARGDLVSVVSMRFSQPPAPEAEPAPTVLTVVSDYRSELVTIIALLLVAFVALRVVRTLRAPVQPALAAAQLPAQLGEDDLDPEALPAGVAEEAEALEEQNPRLDPIPARRMIPTTNSRTRNEVLQTVLERPEVASRLVRAWLREA
jgi:flagellar M-ring protein FliF